MATGITLFLKTDFKRCITDFGYISSYNKRTEVPLIGSYTNKILQTLIKLATYYTSIYKIPIYNPQYVDKTLYFAENSLYIKNDFISVTSLLQFQNSLMRLKDVIDVLKSVPKAPSDLTSLSQYYQAIQNFIKIFARLYDDTPDYGKVFTDYDKTCHRLVYNNKERTGCYLYSNII